MSLRLLFALTIVFVSIISVEIVQGQRDPPAESVESFKTDESVESFKTDESVESFKTEDMKDRILKFIEFIAEIIKMFANGNH
ncbi:unnamed protein product [Trichobilharzia szidati]|nr:unnamed protein product [Trichobilharzia szidati]